MLRAIVVYNDVVVVSAASLEMIEELIFDHYEKRGIAWRYAKGPTDCLRSLHDVTLGDKNVNCI